MTRDDPTHAIGPVAERRVLLLPPTAKDGEAIRQLLAAHAVECVLCDSVESLCDEFTRGVATVVISEEMVIRNADLLAACVAGQPVWSDLPFLVLSRSSVESPHLSDAVAKLGNATLVERPVRLTTFVSLVRSAMRARARQYEVREHLAELDRAGVALKEGAARFKTLFDGIDEGFCIVQVLFDERGEPVDYRFLEANPAFGKLTGLTGVIGKTALGMVPTLERWWVQTYGSVAVTGRPIRFENYAAPLERWFEVYAFSFGLPQNNQVAIFFRNVTARKKTEDALASARQRIESSLLAGEVGTYYWDIATDRVTGDRNFAAMFAVPADEENSVPVGAVLRTIHDDDLPGVSTRMRSSLELGVPFQTEYRVRNGSGYRWVIARGMLDRDDQNRPVGWAGVVVDITERKLVEQERQALLESESAARAEAERVSRMKDEFLATLSHELRTPLNAILGWSQIMRSSRDAEDLTSGLEVIERNARAQSQIIEELLDMSRIISGKVRLDVQRLDLSAIVQAAVETSRPTAEAKGVRLVSVIDPLHGVVVSGDGNRLQQVMWNLLTNAVKFTPKGGRVQVLLQRVESHIKVDVADTGEGIAPEFIPFIFDRFRQADASTTRRHGGLGLGLSIVKQLVELHGGTVSARSDGIGRGTTFSVSIPLTVVNSEPHPEAARRRPGGNAATGDIENLRAYVRGVRVLVVDDEPDARALVKRLLQDCKATVTTAASAREAFELMTAGTFDVLVSDIGMPDENGYSLIHKVRSLGKSRGGDIPAIALTAYARAEDRIKAVAAGFQMHVAKPVEPAELITMIAGAVGRNGPPAV